MVNRWGNSGNSVRLFFFLSFLNLILFFNFIVLVLPYINMNPPQVYTWSPSWTLLPRPSPYYPSGSSQCTNMQYHASILDWWLISYMILYILQCHFPKSSHPFRLPRSPKDCSIHQCLFCCLVYRLVLSRRRQWHPTPVLSPGKSHGWRSLVGCSQWGHKESDTTEKLTFTFHFPALEKEMETHSSVLAWRIPGMGEPGGLPSMGSHRVRHDRSELAAAYRLIATIFLNSIYMR